jgi:hypothetical protein
LIPFVRMGRHLVVFCAHSVSAFQEEINSIVAIGFVPGKDAAKKKSLNTGLAGRGAGMEHIKGRAMCYDMKAADALHEKIKSPVWPTLNNSLDATCVNLPLKYSLGQILLRTKSTLALLAK